MLPGACAKKGFIPNPTNTEEIGCGPGFFNDKACTTICHECGAGRYSVQDVLATRLIPTGRSRRPD